LFVSIATDEHSTAGRRTNTDYQPEESLPLLPESQEEVQELTLLCTKASDAGDQASRLLHSLGKVGAIRIDTRGQNQS